MLVQVAQQQDRQPQPARPGLGATGAALRERGPCTLVGVGANYAINGNVRVSGGVSNLLDKQLYREDNSGNAGANSYNEPGRAYYLTLTASF